jgi:large subunit ribosomal protein L29
MPTATELRELDDDELDTRLVEYRREMLNLRFQLATGQLDNYSRLNEAKRNVARVLTVLRDREIALAEGRDAGPVYIEAPIRPARRRATPAADDVVESDAEVIDPAGDADAIEVTAVEPDEVDDDTGDDDDDDGDEENE